MYEYNMNYFPFQSLHHSTKFLTTTVFRSMPYLVRQLILRGFLFLQYFVIAIQKCIVEILLNTFVMVKKYYWEWSSGMHTPKLMCSIVSCITFAIWHNLAPMVIWRVWFVGSSLNPYNQIFNGAILDKSGLTDNLVFILPWVNRVWNPSTRIDHVYHHV